MNKEEIKHLIKEEVKRALKEEVGMENLENQVREHSDVLFSYLKQYMGADRLLKEILMAIDDPVELLFELMSIEDIKQAFYSYENGEFEPEEL